MRAPTGARQGHQPKGEPMFIKCASKDANIAAATVTLLRPHRFDEHGRALEPYRVSFETGSWHLIVDPNEWAALKKRIDEAFAEAWPSNA